MPNTTTRVTPILAFPIWQTRGIDPATNRCFLIMPFDDPWLRRLYTHHVPEILSEVGLKAQHAGERHGQIITEDIWVALNEARLVLAELTGSNPNVMYELGVAHTLGKPVILLTSGPVEKIPFDIKVLRHVIYERSPAGIRTLKSSLRSELDAVLKEHPFGHMLIAEVESTAASWTTGYRESSMSYPLDKLNYLRVYVDPQFLSDRAISFCAASGCFFGSVGNMIYWGQLCDLRAAAAQDLVFVLFSQHVRTRVRVAHVLSMMSPSTHRAVVDRMLEHHVDPGLLLAIRKRKVSSLVRREFRNLALTPERCEQLLHDLAATRW